MKKAFFTLLAIILFCCPASALDAQTSFSINKTVFSSNEEIMLHFSNLDGSAGYYTVAWEDQDMVILRQPITGENSAFPAPIHKGLYRIDVFSGNQRFSKAFTVSESAAHAISLLGTRLEGGKVNGVRLTWENDMGDCTLTRTDDTGTKIFYHGLNAASFTDVNVKENAVYTYQLQANGYLSNGIVVDFSEFQQAEFVGNHNNGCIELTVNSPYMLVQGVQKQIDADVQIIPYISGDKGRILLPVRAVIEEMGGEISWSGDWIIVSIWGRTLKIPIGQLNVFIDGELREVDVAAEIRDNRTFVPIRYIEYLGCTVDWYQKRGQVLICYPQG